MKDSLSYFIHNIKILLVLVLISGCIKDNATGKNMMLFDFEEDSELDRFAWKCRSRFELSSEYKKTGSKSLKFEFQATPKVGFSTGEVPQDWSIYKTFDFWVYNPSPVATSIYFQVNRRTSSGSFFHLLTRHFKINPGENNISISLDNKEGVKKEVDIFKEVSGFFIYKKDISASTVLFFDAFRLTRKYF